MSGRESVYISGCGGMLGEAFYNLLSRTHRVKCTDIDCNEEWVSPCDVRDLEAYRADVAVWRPDFLFHLAALTDLEYCELHPDEAYLTNTLGVENAVHIANDLDIPLLYISTAGIFDGGQVYYTDWDLPNPMGHYAKSKYYGELFVRENVRRHFILRAGWMMGGGPRKDKKFVKKLAQLIREGRREIMVVDDKFGTPTYTHDFAATAMQLISKGYYGLYNAVCQGLTSRWEVAGEIVRCLGFEDRITLKKVNSEYFKREYFAPRPGSECLVNKKLELRGLNHMGDWKKRLREYLESEFRDYIMP